MHLLAAAIFLLSATPMKVLVLDLRAESVPEQTARMVRDEIAVDMGRDTRLDVLSSEDLRRVVDLDAEKKSMGCDETSCLAEVGAALGARYIVHGSIGVLGTTTIVHLNLFDTEAARSLARETAEAKTPDELLPSVRAALARVRSRILGEPTPVNTATVTEDTGGGLPTLAIVGGGVAGLGVLAAIGGGALMAIAWPTFSNAKEPDDGGVSVDAREGAQTQGMVGTVLLGAGGVLAVGGGALLGLGLME